MSKVGVIAWYDDTLPPVTQLLSLVPHEVAYPRWSAGFVVSTNPDEFPLRAIAASVGLDPDLAWRQLVVGEDAPLELIPDVSRRWLRTWAMPMCDRFATVSVGGSIVGYLIRERP